MSKVIFNEGHRMEVSRLEHDGTAWRAYLRAGDTSTSRGRKENREMAVGTTDMWVRLGEVVEDAKDFNPNRKVRVRVIIAEED